MHVSNSAMLARFHFAMRYDFFQEVAVDFFRLTNWIFTLSSYVQVRAMHHVIERGWAFYWGM